MLFIGADITRMTYSISVVSEHYTFLGQNYFGFDNNDQLISWIKSIALNEYEDIKWFFCEQSYLSNDYNHDLFSLPLFASHKHYLVKDRVVMDFYHTLCEIQLASNRSNVELSLILAMSPRLFEPKFIKLYSKSEQLYLWT